MRHISISTIPGFDEWRIHARELLQNKVSPDQVIWNNADGIQNNLFEESAFLETGASKTTQPEPKVSKAFIEMAQIICCHSDEKRFDLLYRLLWRMAYENKNLLKITTDDDVIRFYAMFKAVRRDAYKISAFLRFREVMHQDTAHYIAWYEPEHYSLELKLGFFTTRFKNMNWSILTPYRAVHWNGKTLQLEDAPDKSLYPENDQVESYWLKYYAIIFNPARVKKQAMLNQMPKKYWKNMPETNQINDLLRHAEIKTKKMLN